MLYLVDDPRESDYGLFLKWSEQGYECSERVSVRFLGKTWVVYGYVTKMRKVDFDGLDKHGFLRG